MRDHEDLFELIPLYALDALEDDEAVEVEAHLTACDECAEELARHRQVAASLVGEGPAPAHVWERIRTVIEGSRPPTITAPTDISERRRPGRLRWLTAAAAIAALVLGVVAVLQRQALERLEGPEAIVAAAEQAAQEPGTVVADLTGEQGTVAQVVVTQDGEGFLIPTDLPPLDRERTYQLWVITADELVISAGVLGNVPAPARFTWSGEIAGFALTREVAGGVVSSEGDLVAAAEI